MVDLAEEKDGNVLCARNIVEREQLEIEFLVVRVVIFEASLQAVEHADGVDDDEADFSGGQFFEALNGVVLFFKVGRPDEYDVVKKFFVRRRKLFQSGCAESAFGVDEDDFFAVLGCLDGGEEGEVCFAGTGGSIDGGDGICFISALKKSVKERCSC